MYATNWVRFGKSVVLPRALNYFNNLSRKGNRNFPQRNSIWQSLALQKG